MAFEIVIVNQRPEIELPNGSPIVVDQPATFIVNFPLVKGDKGDAGSDANVSTHEATYDHGDLHEHSNKGLLDRLSVDGGDLVYDGLSIPMMVAISQEYEGYLEQKGMSSAANEYLFTHDYNFVTWLQATNPALYSTFNTMWTPASVPPELEP